MNHIKRQGCAETQSSSPSTTLYYPTHFMVVKIYGYPMSMCTKRVVVVLNETNTPFDLEVVDLSSASYS
jgi:hypothetical protein